MSVHIPMSKEDALTMLDARIPLTASERRMIVDGLYILAYKEGFEAERDKTRRMLKPIADALAHISELGPNVSDVKFEYFAPGEYEDPTTTIRRNLEEKKRNDR